LREWLGFPLYDLVGIEARQACVDELVNDPLARDGLIDRLAELPDVARLVGRAGLGQASPRDLAGCGMRSCCCPPSSGSWHRSTLP
jgi:DNA mismatch repair protein MutS